MQLQDDAAIKQWLDTIELPDNLPAVLVVVAPHGARFIENVEGDLNQCKMLAGAFLYWLASKVYAAEGDAGVVTYAEQVHDVLANFNSVHWGKELVVYQPGEAELIEQLEGRK